MMSDRELDAAVHLLMGRTWDESRCRVCGWPLADSSDEGCFPDDCCMRPPPARRADETPCYSTNPASAWQLVRDIQELHPGWRFSIVGGDRQMGYIDGSPSKGVDRSRRVAFGWRAEFFGHQDPTQCTGQRHGVGEGQTMPLAIARAALAALSSPLSYTG